MQEAHLYSEIYCETEAAAARLRASRSANRPIFFAPHITQVSATAAQQPATLQSDVATHAPKAEPASSHKVVAPTTPTQVAIGQEVALPVLSAVKMSRHI